MDYAEALSHLLNNYRAKQRIIITMYCVTIASIHTACITLSWHYAPTWVTTMFVVSAAIAVPAIITMVVAPRWYIRYSWFFALPMVVFAVRMFCDREDAEDTIATMNEVKDMMLQQC